MKRFTIAILALFALLLIIHVVLVFNSMLQINTKLGISQLPPIFTRPLEYYHTVLSSRLIPGMTKAEVEGILRLPDRIEQATRDFGNGEEDIYRYHYHIHSTKLEENEMYIYVFFQKGKLERFVIDNS